MKLKIAIQKTGRLLDDSVKLLKDCGIDLNNGINKLRAEAHNFPLEVMFFRDDDIPQYVADGVVDIGIVGENIVFEKAKQVTVADRLGFAKCRLALAVPKGTVYENIAQLEGKKIATSYPAILAAHLAANNISAEIHELSGSVEIAPGIGLADAVCDIVSSGSTLFLNGLIAVETVMHSEAVLIASTTLSDAKKILLDKLRFRIDAVKKSRKYKYILLNAPNDKLQEISAIIPGMKSPTILPLATEGWSSLHSVVHEDDFWNVIECLKELGSEGILVSPIEKMIV